jgi:hypothetical protein
MRTSNVFRARSQQQQQRQLCRSQCVEDYTKIIISALDFQVDLLISQSLNFSSLSYSLTFAHLVSFFFLFSTGSNQMEMDSFITKINEHNVQRIDNALRSIIIFEDDDDDGEPNDSPKGSPYCRKKVV